MVREEIYPLVRDIVADALRVKPAVLTPESRLREQFGADSMHLVSILIGLDAAFDQEFDPEAIPKSEVTLNWIVDHVTCVLGAR